MSWNPLPARAPHIGPHHLAAAKLLALAAAEVVARKALTAGRGEPLEAAAGWVAMVAALLLLLNRRPRWMMALLALALAVGEYCGGFRFPGGTFGIPAGLTLLAAIPYRPLSVAAAAALYWVPVAAPAVTAPSVDRFLGSPALVGYLLALAAIRPLPPLQPVVIWDGTCGLCHFSRRWLSRLDMDHALSWKTLQSQPGEAAGVPAADLSARLHLRWGAELLRGYDAVKRVVLTLPATLLLVALAGLLGRVLHPYIPLLITAALLLLASPLSNAPGRWVYDWVARNRRRWWREAACVLPDPRDGDQPPLA